jgi:nucleoside-diphosphate-sugar epimerase
MASSSNHLVLVTGVNGFIAARTAEYFLLANYNVRGTVRSHKSEKAIREALSEYVDAGRFETVIVEDITVPGAFDKAVEGSL